MYPLRKIGTSPLSALSNVSRLSPSIRRIMAANSISQFLDGYNQYPISPDNVSFLNPIQITVYINMLFVIKDRFYGLVVRVPATDPEVPGSIPDGTRFSEK
jgi:hypothetical protein